MSARNCIASKTASGKVSKKLGRAAQERIDEIVAALEAQGEAKSAAMSWAESLYGDELKRQTAKEKWRLVNAVRVRRELQAAVDAADPVKLGGMAMKMVDDLDFDARAWQKRINGRAGEFLTRHKVTIKGGVTNAASFENVLKALRGEAVPGDPAAQALADAVNDINEWSRKKLNSYGYSIGKLDGWGYAQTHSAISIGNAGEVEWPKSIDKLLDWAGMIDPKTGVEFGRVPSQQYRYDFLEATYDSIVYGRDSENPKWGG